MHVCVCVCVWGGGGGGGSVKGGGWEGERGSEESCDGWGRGAVYVVIQARK